MLLHFSEKWWARRDLNPRPSGYEPDALTRLSYGPHFTVTILIKNVCCLDAIKHKSNVCKVGLVSACQ
jgi:hypothetical protein